MVCGAHDVAHQVSEEPGLSAWSWPEDGQHDFGWYAWTLNDPREPLFHVRCHLLVVEHEAKMIAEPFGAGGRWRRTGEQSRGEHLCWAGRDDVRPTAGFDR